MTAPDTVLRMVIEQTRHYPMRMIYNSATGTFSASEHRSLLSARDFPYPYGWICGSGTPPGPHRDCILISEKEYALGDEAEIRIIGVFKRNDGDHKYVAVELRRDARDISELSAEEKASLHRLYPRAREGEGWFGRDEAASCMERCAPAL